MSTKNISYKVWQTEDENQEFLSYKKERFDFSKYNLKYEGTIVVDKINEKEDLKCLEELFFILNCMHPADYHTRSLSVSDVVEINNNFYFCDSFCWRPLSKNEINK